MLTELQCCKQYWHDLCGSNKRATHSTTTSNHTHWQQITVTTRFCV